MRSRKTSHIKAVAERLVAGADTPEELAERVINLIDQLREDDCTYTVVCQYDGSSDLQEPFYLAYGPYPTMNKAVDALEKGRVGISGFGKKAIVPVYTPEHVAKRFDSIDDLGQKHDAHWVRVWEKASV